jgi:gas vesicle protein
MKLFGFILLLSAPFASSIAINCEFKNDVWSYVGDLYTCDLISSNISITARGSVVTAATGNHLNSMNHASVTGFASWISSNTINFIPRGLNDVFPNLVGILMKSCRMKKIRQADLRPFPKLKYLSLRDNDIETIERDLFKYNPQLQYINLDYNKINRVHPNVFDQLNELNYFDLDNNACVTGYGTNRTSVLELVAKMKNQCQSDVDKWTQEIEESVSNISNQVKSHIENTKNQYDELALRVDLNLATQTYLNEKFNDMSKRMDKLEQHIAAIVDAISNKGTTTTP